MRRPSARRRRSDSGKSKAVNTHEPENYEAGARIRREGKPFAFSHGLFDFDDGQFGLVTVNDDGGPTVQVIIRGRQMQNELVSFTFDSPRAAG
ncbi:MAG: hypothetical protein ABW250_27440 [Pyrinomonadaceae bacterium]